MKKKRREKRSKISFGKSDGKPGGMASTKPELLSPAGNLESFFAAIEGGADAVYLGLDRFNARMRADNFSVTDLSKLIPYARKKGVRVYIAMNTKILEGELPYFIDIVSRALIFKPHAFILGDLGSIGIFKTHFPGAEVHASTLMGNFNSRTLSVLEGLGVSRAILERHLTFSQLKETVRRSPIDVELFVHGALCFSYSGMCFFSSFLGGKSGNRGECVQPCRRIYRMESSGEERAFFSARDLSLMEILPDLVKTGVKAFKIEGRLRDADHIFNVVSAYRKAVDMIHDGAPDKGVGEGMEILKSTLGRERTAGMLSGTTGGVTVSSSESGAIGEFLGRVDGVSSPFVHCSGVFEVKKGDRLRVQDGHGGGGTGFTLRVISRRKGKTWLKVPFEVKEQDLLFRVSSRGDRRKLSLQALEKFNGLRSTGLDFKIEVGSRKIKITGSMNNFKRSYTFRLAGSGPGCTLPEGELKRLMVDSYRGDLPVGNLEIVPVDGSPFSQGDMISTFEKASKEFDKALHLYLKKERWKIISSFKLKGVRRGMRPTGLFISVNEVKDAEAFMGVADRVIVDFSKNLVRKPRKLASLSRDWIVFRLPVSASDSQMTFYRNGIERAVSMGFKDFVIPDLGWVKVFRELRIAKVVNMISDHFLYTFNSASCLTLQGIGFSRFILPLESNLKNLEKNGKYLKGLGIFPAYMNVPLLVTRLKADGIRGETSLVSKMGERFHARSDEEGTVIHSEERFCVSGHMEKLMKAGINDFLVDLRWTDPGERESIVDKVIRDDKIDGTVPFNLFRENL